MPKCIPISVVDTLLDKIASANIQVVFSEEPTSRGDAVKAFKLGLLRQINRPLTSPSMRL